ncbi:MAG: Rossmann-like and DUF2520 domain-containing protein [Syntrophales bacterium]|jgi:predicted short-subunit dehydrogenase-like oxidoreductase (DUF2520 family)
MNTQEIRGDTVAILGLGKVGRAVGFLLRQAGYRIVAVASRSKASLTQGIVYTGGKSYLNFSEAARAANCIIIATSDDAIAHVCKEISREGGIKPGAKVIHMSGAGGLDLLESAEACGAHVACIHPLQSFPDVDSAVRNIPGSTFGITSSDEIKEWSAQVVRDLGGVPFFISDADKPLYHAAASIASNYLTTLIHMVEEIYQSLGLNREETIRAIWPLVMGTIANIETKGTVQALTGPVARGDAGTVRKHVDALRQKLPALLQAYSALGILTADLGLRKKTLSPKTARLIKKILK